MEAKIKKLSSQNIPIIGICGGFQMLGTTISDPYEVEGGGDVRGMELIDMTTVFEQEKVTTRVSGTTRKIDGFFASLSNTTFTGYEIHMGKTYSEQEMFADLSSGVKDGLVADNILGSYVHGIFDEGTFYDELIKLIAENKGIDITVASNIDYDAFKETQYDKLAQGMREGIDMDTIYRIIKEGI